MKRREFISFIAGVAAWPLTARAQQPARVRTIGVLLPLVENDSFAREQVGAVVTALQQAGWIEGQNVHFESRWAGPIPSDIRRHAADLVVLRPDLVYR